MALLKLGSKGFEVGAVQGALGLPVTNVYDKPTMEKVREFQAKSGLLNDGIFGPTTRNQLFGMTKNVITEQAYTECAKRLDVEPAILKAFATVESRGDGFLTDGRAKILYERHWAYKLLEQKGMDVENMQLLIPRLVNKTPGDYLDGAGSWEKFEIMEMIDMDVAIQCCSWGTFQIMGFHWKEQECSSPLEFMQKAMTNSTAHLEMLAEFIRDNAKLHKAIREKNFLLMAQIYNGPNQKGYDKAMAEAFSRYSK